MVDNINPVAALQIWYSKNWSPGADGTFQWPPPARSRQCPQWHESCFHSSVLQPHSGETCCKEKEVKCCFVIDSAFSGMPLIPYADCAKVISTFLGKKQYGHTMAASFTLPLDARTWYTMGVALPWGSLVLIGAPEWSFFLEQVWKPLKTGLKNFH